MTRGCQELWGLVGMDVLFSKLPLALMCNRHFATGQSLCPSSMPQLVRLCHKAAHSNLYFPCLTQPHIMAYHT